MASAEWQKVFAIDLRSLAALRMALALLILADLAIRLPLLEVLYTDSGVFPRAAFEKTSYVPASLHLLHGSVAFQATLFALAGLFAIGLFTGYRTRICTIACWVLLVSLNIRNPYVRDGGDQILRLLLFWSLFLPLGARWSLDSRRRPISYKGLVSLAGVALLIQPFFVYFFSAVAKIETSQWQVGTAVLHSVSDEHGTLPLGLWLRSQPTLCQGLTWGALALEFVAPLLLLAPWWKYRLRWIGIISLVSLQVGLALCIDLNLFPWISTAMLIPFLPGRFWDAVARGSDAGQGLMRTKVSDLVVLVPFLFALSTATFSTLGLGVFPRSVKSFTSQFGLFQHWTMYAPPPTSSERLLVSGTRTDGVAVAIDDGDRVSWAPWKSLRDDYRGLSYVEGVSYEDQRVQLEALSAWICTSYNRGKSEDQRIQQLNLTLIEKPHPVPGNTAENKAVRLHDYSAPKGE